ncbi:hypothetical protein MAHJHV57_54370 [Mycobacterium avium subsp. hominissuis]
MHQVLAGHGAVHVAGEHLMHESTAWLLALGLAMIAATRIASHMPLLLGLAFALLVAVTSPSKASTMT